MSHSEAALGHRTETPVILAQLKLREGQLTEEVENWCALDQAGESVDQLNSMDIYCKITLAKKPQMSTFIPIPRNVTASLSPLSSWSNTHLIQVRI